MVFRYGVTEEVSPRLTFKIASFTIFKSAPLLMYPEAPAFNVLIAYLPQVES